MNVMVSTYPYSMELISVRRLSAVISIRVVFCPENICDASRLDKKIMSFIIEGITAWIYGKKEIENLR